MLFNKRKSRTGSLTLLPKVVLWGGNKSTIELKITYHWFFWDITSQVFHSTACFTLYQNGVAPYLSGPIGFLKPFLHYLIWSAEQPLCQAVSLNLGFLCPKIRMCRLPKPETSQPLSEFTRLERAFPLRCILC